MRAKKYTSLVLAAVMVISMVGCGKKEVSQENNTEPSTVTTVTQDSEEKEETPIITEYEGEPAINEKRFGELMEVVELTTENWRDYLEIVSYDEEIITKNDFGEIVYEKDENGEDIHNIITRRVLVVDTDKYYYFNGVPIEFINKETNESVMFTLVGEGEHLGSDSLLEGLDAYECARVQGNIIIVDLPEEAICSPLESWGYECGFQLTNAGRDCTPYRINPYTHGIRQNGSGDWVEKYIDYYKDK